MSKPTTAQRLTAIENGLATVLDRLEEATQRATAPAASPPANDDLVKLLYGAVIRFGMSIPGAPGGVVATAQIPLMDIAADTQLTWELLENNTVLVRVVQPPGEHDSDEVADPVNTVIDEAERGDAFDQEMANLDALRDKDGMVIDDLSGMID